MPSGSSRRGSVPSARLRTPRPPSSSHARPSSACATAGRAESPASRIRAAVAPPWRDRKSTRLNSSHSQISYAVFCLKKKKNNLVYCEHVDLGEWFRAIPLRDDEAACFIACLVIEHGTRERTLQTAFDCERRCANQYS